MQVFVVVYTDDDTEDTALRGYSTYDEALSYCKETAESEGAAIKDDNCYYVTLHSKAWRVVGVPYFAPERPKVTLDKTRLTAILTGLRLLRVALASTTLPKGFKAVTGAYHGPADPIWYLKSLTREIQTAAQMKDDVM